MNRKSKDTLVLGSNVLNILLPHRRPFLMVDRITAYTRTPRPVLRAERHISANEPIFTGHFRDLHLWPGVCTIEGLGQSCNLLQVLFEMQQEWEKRGGDAEDVLAALRNLQLAYRLQPGFRQDMVDALMENLPDTSELIGFAASIEIKLHAPVFAGQRLDYEVCRTHLINDMLRFEVEAQVEGQTVAKGLMTSKMGIPLPRKRAPQ